VRAALDAILASVTFRSSPQLSAFLRYVVMEALAGRGHEIKGYSIATMALGRPSTFDPQADPIVRVQAGRLRLALEEYHSANPEASIVILMERGTYAPRFEPRRAADRPVGKPAAAPLDASAEAMEIVARAPPAATAVRPNRRLVVAGLVAASTAGLAAAGAVLWRRTPEPPLSTASTAPPPPESFYPTLTVEADPPAGSTDLANLAARIRDAVARFDDLVVVADGADMEGAPAQRRQRRAGWDLILRLTAMPAGDGKVRLGVRLLDAGGQRVVWARDFEQVSFAVEDDSARTVVVRSIATTLAQPYGVIHAYVRAAIARENRAIDPYGCVVGGLDYWLSNDRAVHSSARACIMDRLKAYPNFGPLHSQLTYLHLEEYRQGYNPLPGSPVARALESARLAVLHRPTSARSHQSLMAALYTSGDLAGAWRAADDALALNPDDTEIIADVGTFRIMAGDFELGLSHIERAMALNPAPPAWVITFRALALYMLGRLEQSGPMVSALEGSRYAPAQMALIMAAYQFRDAPGGRRRLAAFREQHPELQKDPSELLRRMNFQEVVIARVMRDYDLAVKWIGEQ
jgi:hypothetical protein